MSRRVLRRASPHARVVVEALGARVLAARALHLYALWQLQGLSTSVGPLLTSVAPLLHLCCTSVSSAREFSLRARCISTLYGNLKVPSLLALLLHLCCNSVAPLLHLYGTSVAPLLHLCCTSVASLLHLCCTSVAPLLHLCCSSVAP